MQINHQNHHHLLSTCNIVATIMITMIKFINHHHPRGHRHHHHHNHDNKIITNIFFVYNDALCNTLGNHIVWCPPGPTRSRSKYKFSLQGQKQSILISFCISLVIGSAKDLD